MTSVCNTEKCQLEIIFGKAKHLKVSVILFKTVRKFFAQKIKPMSFFSKMRKRGLGFTIENFHMQLLKHTQSHSKLRRLDCGSLTDFSEILEIISEHIKVSPSQ